MKKFIYSNHFPNQSEIIEPMDSTVSEKRVLVVEDEEMVLKVIRIFLSLEGFNILVAATEEEAVVVVDACPGKIDLLLADVRLPQGSGPGVARRIRETHPETKVVFMSGYSREVLIEEGQIQREDAFLPKPFDAKTFRNTLRLLMAGDHSWTGAV